MNLINAFTARVLSIGVGVMHGLKKYPHPPSTEVIDMLTMDVNL